MRLAIVTGANGFLGLNLVEQLAAAGWQVLGLCLPGTELRYLQRFPARIVEGDILDPEALAAAIPDDADAVFHTAASTSIWSRNNAMQTRINVRGTENVLRACAERRVKRVVHTSTWNTYGPEHAVISEETPQTGGRSRINYVRSKFLAEAAARAAAGAGLHVVIMNPTHMIGRYDIANWGRMFLMVNESRLPGIPRTRGAFCHAEAVAKAHVAAAEAGRRGENYLLPGVEADFAEIIAMIGRLTGKPVPKGTVPVGLLRVIARLKVLKAGITGREPDLTPEGVDLLAHDPGIDSDKAARELGYRTVPLRVMIEDAFDWLKAEGFLK